MIWDKWTYNPEVEISKGIRKEINDRKQAEVITNEDLKGGNLKFTLYGEKFRGSFALFRTAGFKTKTAWLLIKHHDEYSRKGYDANNYDFSAVSGRTLDEIVAGQK